MAVAPADRRIGRIPRRPPGIADPRLFDAPELTKRRLRAPKSSERKHCHLFTGLLHLLVAQLWVHL